MKHIYKIAVIFVLFLFALTSLSDELKKEQSYLYSYDEGLILVIPREQTVAVELLDYFHATSTDRIEISSRYSVPVISTKVIGKNHSPVLFIQSTDGGTNAEATDITVVTIKNGKLKKSEPFILSEYQEPPEKFNYKLNTVGQLNLNDSGLLTYKWKTTGYDNNKSLNSEGTDMYQYQDGEFIKSTNNAVNISN